MYLKLCVGGLTPSHIILNIKLSVELNVELVGYNTFHNFVAIMV